jgi:hypothetical protein
MVPPTTKWDQGSKRKQDAPSLLAAVYIVWMVSVPLLCSLSPSPAAELLTAYLISWSEPLGPNRALLPFLPTPKTSVGFFPFYSEQAPLQLSQGDPEPGIIMGEGRGSQGKDEAWRGANRPHQPERKLSSFL